MTESLPTLKFVLCLLKDLEDCHFHGVLLVSGDAHKSDCKTVKSRTRRSRAQKFSFEFPLNFHGFKAAGIAHKYVRSL